jgi:hypothetical protein
MRRRRARRVIDVIWWCSVILIDAFGCEGGNSGVEYLELADN